MRRYLAHLMMVSVGVLGSCDTFRTGPLTGVDAGVDVREDIPRPLDAGCDGGPCKRALGVACTSASTCLSGFCADGVCCNVACQGQCEYCNGNQAGTCAAVTGQPQGSRAACTGTGACAKECTGTDRTQCVLPSTSTCPVCGNHTCETGETCSSCPVDCGPCAVACVGCSTDNPCSDGGTCQQRPCDGTLGCFTTGGPACETIDGTVCPAVSAYMTCTSNTDCGPSAACMMFSDTGPMICSKLCNDPSDCPVPPTGYPGVTAQCFEPELSSQDQCLLACTGPGTCPYGLTCQPLGTGSSGYCD